MFWVLSCRSCYLSGGPASVAQLVSGQRTTKVIYAVYVALILVAFCVVFNGFLRGAKKAQIDAGLSVLLVGLVTSAFFLGGWKLGLLSLAIFFLAGIVTRPIAARSASKLLAMLAGGRGVYPGLPPRRLQTISQELAKPSTPQKLMEEIVTGGGRKAAAEDALFDYCEQEPTIQPLLKEFQISRDGLQRLYSQLIVAGAGQWASGHWVAASALAYPESLQYVLSRRGKDMQETAFKLITYFERGLPLET